MPRVARQQQWTAEACYHITSRGHNRESVFRDDADRRAFLHLIARYRQRFDFRLFHYCLMSNHFHLLVQLPDPKRLSAMVAGLLLAYFHHYHRRYGLVGHLWQGRFKSPAIQREGYWLSCGRYVERNPVEAQLVAEPWHYPWSSCRAYALGEADPLLSVNPCYEELAAEPGRRQQLWRAFLEDDDPREEVVQQAEWAVGDDDFRQRWQAQRGRPTQRRRGRPRKTTTIE